MFMNVSFFHFMKNVYSLKTFSHIVMNETMNVTTLQEYQDVLGDAFSFFFPTILFFFEVLIN